MENFWVWLPIVGLGIAIVAAGVTTMFMLLVAIFSHD
jgi:hypothetical protein